MKRQAAVFNAAAMASEHNLLFFTAVLLGSILSCQGRDEEFSDAVKNVFLSKPLNASESEGILKSARESFLFLKNVEKLFEPRQKSNFAKNYAYFLTQLFQQVRTKDVDVRELFSKENAFLKGYNESAAAASVNLTEVQVAVEKFQSAAERLLVPYYNSSGELHEAAEILNLENSTFDSFLKEKLRADYSEVGYFLLEVFATLIGLSWGVISTVIHVAQNMGGE